MSGLAGVVVRSKALSFEITVTKVSQSPGTKALFCEKQRVIFCFSELAVPERKHKIEPSLPGTEPVFVTLNIEFCFAFGIVRFFRFDFKICIRQTESEFIQHLFGGEGFKIAVTHKDVLNIVVDSLCAEAVAARVVLISFCDCIAGVFRSE